MAVKDADAFQWLHNLRKFIPYQIEDTPVEDEIYYYQDVDFFNYSTIDNLKFFIEKNDETLETIKLLFYDINGEKRVNLKVGGTISHNVINRNKIVDLGFNSTNYQNVIIEMDSIEYDITEVIKKVKHNIIK